MEICRAPDVKAIWQKCAPLDQNQRRAMGLTQKNKKTGLLTMPGYGALNNGDELKSETRYFITSLEQDSRSSSRLGEAIRGHWSVENKNHWKRDTSQWKEDATRPRKKASGGQVLALLRGAVLRLHDKEAFATLNASFHHHSARPYAGLRLLKTPPPKIN